MKFIQQAEYTPEFLEEASAKDENIYRRLLIKLISDIEINQLNNINIRYFKTDPFSEESKKILNNPFSEKIDIQEILLLRDRKTIRYRIELITQ